MRSIGLFIVVAGFAVMTKTGGSTAVIVEGGTVQGRVDRGIRVFEGIPYAAPPIGPLRWSPPRPVQPWPGVRDASSFGAECPQTQYAEGSVYIRPLQQQSEDCLFVNVWTSAAGNDKQPVLVWIHGGALTRGSGISDTRDGVPLAKKGVVLVTVNYRLGALGYLAHPELTAESPNRSSGNYGVLDQIAALKWVRTNIAAFGGDPARVTIGGESAGSWAVNALVASPLAKGLFIRAIGESGGRFNRTPSLEEESAGLPSAENVGLGLAKSVGAASVKELRALPSDKLLDVPGFRTQENVDGWVLPAEIRTIFLDRKQNIVPVIVGSNADEMTSFLTPGMLPKTVDEYKKRIGDQYGRLAESFDAAYGPVQSASDIAAVLLGAARDTTFSLHMRTWARLTTAAGARAYLYSFSHVAPHPRASELKAFHASEIPYVFDVVPSSDPREAGFAYTEVDRRLANMMSTYWVNFVKTGDPNGAGVPKWEVYNPAAEPYLEFGDTVRPGQHLLKAQLDFLERLQAAR
ncbi:MAG TPA: carboxylesterase family protein [Vicinamibacterales bacterium]